VSKENIPKERRAKRGVPIIIKRKLSRNVTDWKSIDENFIRQNLNWIQRNITIIKIYATSEVEAASTKDHFFATLNKVLADIASTRELFLLGDFNGRTGREVNNKIVDSYGEERVNNNGTRLIYICKYNNLTIKMGFSNINRFIDICGCNRTEI